MAPKKRDDEESTDPNVLPVMNIMFLMIPALLLAMEIAKMASISVSPPKLCAVGCQSEAKEDPPPEPLDFKVSIADDGFRISTAGEPQTIPLSKPTAPMSDYERYDYAALETLAKALKQQAKHETVVTLTADGDVPMQVLTSAMDAVRGSDCKMGMLAEGEPLPDECLFIRPTVSAGST